MAEDCRWVVNRVCEMTRQGRSRFVWAFRYISIYYNLLRYSYTLLSPGKLVAHWWSWCLLGALKRRL